MTINGEVAVVQLCSFVERRLSKFSTALTQKGLAEFDQPGKNPLQCSATADRERMEHEIDSFSH